MIVPFEPAHIQQIEVHATQTLFFHTHWDEEQAQAVASSGPCFTMIHDGKVLCCSGVSIQWEGRAIAWAIMSKDAGPHMRRIFKAIADFFNINGSKRVEAHVDPSEESHRRFITMLGFELEGRMRAFSPDGRDFELYARIK